jgi:hypothetical protein
MKLTSRKPTDTGVEPTTHWSNCNQTTSSMSAARPLAAKSTARNGAKRGADKSAVRNARSDASLQIRERR